MVECHMVWGEVVAKINIRGVLLAEINKFCAAFILVNSWVSNEIFLIILDHFDLKVVKGVIFFNVCLLDCVS